MDMSRAALPPAAPAIPESARSHPLYSKYLAYRSGCSRNMIDASRWEDWLYQIGQDARDTEWRSHPRYSEFLAWMRASQGGLPRKGNPGNFPVNFEAWLTGARW